MVSGCGAVWGAGETLVRVQRLREGRAPMPSELDRTGCEEACAEAGVSLGEGSQPQHAAEPVFDVSESVGSEEAETFHHHALVDGQDLRDVHDGGFR